MSVAPIRIPVIENEKSPDFSRFAHRLNPVAKLRNLARAAMGFGNREQMLESDQEIIIEKLNSLIHAQREAVSNAGDFRDYNQVADDLSKTVESYAATSGDTIRTEMIKDAICFFVDKDLDVVNHVVQQKGSMNLDDLLTAFEQTKLASSLGANEVCSTEVDVFYAVQNKESREVCPLPASELQILTGSAYNN